MKPNQLLMSLTAISVLLLSCQSAKIDLVGEWSGKTTNDCEHYPFNNKDAVSIYTFSKDGVCKHSIEVNNGEMDNELTFPDSKFSIVEDSLVLDYQDSIGSRNAFILEVKGKNEIELKKTYTDLEDSTKECHSIWMLTRK